MVLMLAGESFRKWTERAYGGVVVGIGVIDVHVLKEPFDVVVEEALNFSIIEFGVNEESANVRLDDIGECLKPCQ